MATMENSNGLDREMRITKMIADSGDDSNTFRVRQALTFSLEWADAYNHSHCFGRAGMTPDATAAIAMARLELALREGRGGLAGILTPDYLRVLCNTFQAEIAIPDDFRSLATAVADEYGVDVDTYEQSRLAPLLDMLMGLSFLQRLALRDLVEQFWYVGQHEFDSMEAFLKANGIEGPAQ